MAIKFDDRRDDTRDRYDDDRPSWREIDRRKDRSFHVSEKKPARSKKKSWEEAREKSEKLAALNSLFGGKKPDKEENKYLKAISEAKDKESFKKAVARYEKKYGLPRDWDTLLLLLDHPESRVVLHAVKHLSALYPHRTEEERELLRGHLRLLKMTTYDEEIESAADGLLSSL